MHTTNRISENMHDAADSSKEFVGEHPISTTLAAFGMGLGLGVAVAYLLTEGSSHRNQSGLAHRLGRQMLDAMSSAIPDSLSHFGR